MISIAATKDAKHGQPSNKAILSDIMIAVISEAAKRFPGLGALIASLPLVSVLGMIWLWREKSDTENMAMHAGATFWYVTRRSRCYC